MEQFAKQGKTPLLFADETQIIGVFAVADVVKPTSREARRADRRGRAARRSVSAADRVPAR